MILLLGYTGYIGSAFAHELSARNIPWTHTKYTDWSLALPSLGPSLVINCGAFIPPESVSKCDNLQAETIRGNLLLPASLALVCSQNDIALAHISTACLWSDGKEHAEDDPPQRAFNGYCGFYVGTKVMAEEEVRKCPKHYIWRVRLPFDEFDSSRNYLSKLAVFPEVFDHTNSVSHRGDFVKACLDLVASNAPFGTYNVTNPGSISAMAIVRRLQEMGIRKDAPLVVTGNGGETKVNVAKLLATGVKMRDAEQAVHDSLKNWVPRNHVHTS